MSLLPTVSAQQTEAVPDADRTSYWARDFSLSNVDAETVVDRLQRLGVEVPFQLDGKVSLNATVWIPFGNLLTPSKYRLDATLTSPRLTIDAIQLAEATIQFQFDEGRLFLRDLQGTLVDVESAQAAGRLSGSGSAQLLPLAGLRLELHLRDLQLPTVNRDIMRSGFDLHGIMSGDVTLSHPDIRKLGSLPGWRVEGNVQVNGFAIDAERQWDLELQTLRVEKGVLQANGLVARQGGTGDSEASSWSGGIVRGNATASLSPPGPVTLQASVNQLDLAHAVASLQLDVPLAGIASGSVELENPSLQQLEEEEAWKATAELAIASLQYAGYPAPGQRLQIRAGKLALENGQLTLDDFAAEQSAIDTDQLTASVQGSGSAALFPAGPVQFDVTLQSLRLSSLVPADAEHVPPFFDGAVQGTASGRLQASHPQIEEVNSWNRWSGSGALSVRRFSIGKRPPIDVELGHVRFDPDGISVPQLLLQGEQWQSSAQAEIDWTAPQPFRLSAATTGIPLADLYWWASGRTAEDAVTGQVAFELQATGQGDPWQWQSDGALVVPDANLFGIRIENIDHQFEADAQHFAITPRSSRSPETPAANSAAQQSPGGDTLRLGRVESQYAWTENAFRVEDFLAELFGGVVEGSGSLAFPSGDPADTDRHRGQLRWRDLAYDGTLTLPDSTIRLAAMTQGDIDWSVPFDRVDDPRAHQFQASAVVSSLSLATVPLGNLELEIASQPQQWRAELSGDLLQGSAQGEATADLTSVSGWDRLAEAMYSGELAIDGVEVSRLIALWQRPENAQKWRGQTNLQWSFQSSGLRNNRPAAADEAAGSIVESAPAQAEEGSTPGSRFQADGTINVIDLVFDGRRLTDRLSLQAGFDGETFTVKQLSGSFAGGRLGASGNWRRSGASSGLNFLLTGVDASRALLVVSPSLAAEISGTVSGRLVVAGQQELRGSGRLECRDLRIHSFRLGTMRSSVDGAFDFATQRWRARFSNIAGAVARGRIRGGATLTSSPGRSDRFNLDSQWELSGVDFERVVEDLSVGRSAPGKGKISGKLVLKGRAIASAADLEGSLDARLGGTEATAVPGLPVAENQLGFLSLRNTRFEAGEVHGRFRRGTFFLSELWLDSDQLRVWADGKVSLDSARWDIDVVIATGDFEQANVTVLTLAEQVALDAALPISVIVRVNEALSDRVVYLRLSGPISQPRIRIQAGQTLSENAARFFLRSLTKSLAPIPTPGSNR